MGNWLKSFFATANAKNSVVTLLIRIISTLASFITAMLLARWLGAKSFGEYSYALAWVRLLSVPATFGLQQFLVRQVSVYLVQEQWKKLKGLWRYSNLLVLVSSLSIILVAGVLVFVLQRMESGVSTFLLALPLVFLLSLVRVRQATLRGFNQIVAGQMPDFVIRPLFLLFGVIILHYGYAGIFNAQSVMISHVSMAAIALLAGQLWYTRFKPINMTKPKPVYEGRKWFILLLPLLLTISINIVNNKIDIIILGFFSDNATIGIYNVAKKLVDFIPFILISVNTTIAPSIAKLYAEQNLEKLQRIISRGAFIIMLGTLPIVVILILFRTEILAIFGQEFIAGNTVLIILSLGQLINAAIGSVGVLLIMTNYEKDVLFAGLVSAISNIVLNIILIPLLGIVGASLASVMSITMWNGILLSRVHRKLGIATTILVPVEKYLIRKKPDNFN